MNIHEYQAKAVLREFGVPVPRGHAAFSVDEAVKAGQADGLLGMAGDRLRLTPRGRLFASEACLLFLAPPEARTGSPEAARTAVVERLAEALFRDFPGESGRTIRLK